MAITFPDNVMFFDIESHGVDELFTMPPREYCRLFQFAHGEGPIHTTTDYDEFLSHLRKAKMVVGHNIHQFDLLAIFGLDSTEALTMAVERRVFDTMTHATLVNPAPPFYFNSEGKKTKSDTPGTARRWFSLNNQAFQLGTPLKTMDLKKYANTFLWREDPVYSEKTGKLLKRTKRVKIEDLCCGFGAIPQDDEIFVEYAIQDIVATREVARGLLSRFGPMDDYAWREQLKAGIDGQITRNGFKVDQALAMERVVETAEEAAWILDDLNNRYGMPLDGKKPLATSLGKEALLQALHDVGVKDRYLARTDNGSLSFSGDSVKAAVEKVGSEEALALGEAVATLAGQRSLPELALKCVKPDGRVHPSIVPLQKSGRKSITEPGLTVWNSHGPKARQKDYFIPDNEDHVLMEFDLSNADARAVAALSGDTEFAKRFEPGQDGHMINAIAAWGEETVLTDPHGYRFRAKAPGHGWSYRIGSKKLAATTGLSIAEAKEFLDNLNQAFQGVVSWQNSCTEYAIRYGYVINEWGRKMPVDKGREFTQPPALQGQSTTNEMISDGLIRLPLDVLRMVKITVHDALVLSVPKDRLDEVTKIVVQSFSTKFKPQRKGSLEIEFPLGHGEPGNNWREAHPD